ncbi:MAG: hypothetical protein AAF623_05235 [Planctomycetota bacterium]
MANGDFDVAYLTQPKGIAGEHAISGVHDVGFHILFANLDVWFISNEIPFDNLSKFFTIKDASRYDRNEYLGEYRIR